MPWFNVHTIERVHGVYPIFAETSEEAKEIFESDRIVAAEEFVSIKQEIDWIEEIDR